MPFAVNAAALASRIGFINELFNGPLMILKSPPIGARNGGSGPHAVIRGSTVSKRSCKDPRPDPLVKSMSQVINSKPPVGAFIRVAILSRGNHNCPSCDRMLHRDDPHPCSMLITNQRGDVGNSGRGGIGRRTGRLHHRQEIAVIIGRLKL